MNPVAMDTVVAALLGFDFNKIPQVREAYNIKELPLTLFQPEDIQVVGLPGIVSIKDIYTKKAFVPAEPSLGWRGHVEYRSGGHAE